MGLTDQQCLSPLLVDGVRARCTLDVLGPLLHARKRHRRDTRFVRRLGPWAKGGNNPHQDERSEVTPQEKSVAWGAILQKRI